MPSRLNSSSAAQLDRRERASEILRGLLSGDGYSGFCKLAQSWLSSSDQGEDAVQSAAASFITTFDPDRDSDPDYPAAYFTRAVINHAHKVRRSRQRHPTSELYGASSLAGSGEVSAIVGDREEIRVAIGKVPERSRAVFLMGLLGYKRAEVCGALGISERTRRRLLEQANRAIAAEVDEH